MTTETWGNVGGKPSRGRRDSSISQGNSTMRTDPSGERNLEACKTAMYSTFSVPACEVCTWEELDPTP